MSKPEIKNVLEDFIFFFTHAGDLYGSGEIARVTFAKMKDPKDEDNNPGWLKEANFTAFNLKKLMKGEQGQMVFGKKELKNIKVVDKDKIEKMLKS